MLAVLQAGVELHCVYVVKHQFGLVGRQRARHRTAQLLKVLHLAHEGLHGRGQHLLADAGVRAERYFGREVQTMNQSCFAFDVFFDQPSYFVLEANVEVVFLIGISPVRKSWDFFK